MGDVLALPSQSASALVDLDAERAVLAAMLLDDSPEQSATAALLALVQPGDFADVRHAHVDAAMRALHARREPIDVVTVAAEMRSRGVLHAVGGAQFLGSLTDELPTLAWSDKHAAIVASLARQRAMVSLAREFAARVERGTDAAFELRDRIVGALAALDRPGAASVSMRSLVESYLDGMVAAEGETDGDRAMPTGIPALDGVVRMTPGKLIALGALPGVGKSALALQAALYVARHGRRVLFLSAEMGATEIRDRAIAHLAGVDLGRVSRMRPLPDEMSAIDTACVALARLPLVVHEVSSRQWSEAAGAAARLSREAPFALVVVDHLHELSAVGFRERRFAVEHIASESKRLAVAIGCPVLLLGALNRGMAAERNFREPRAQDFRETAMIESIADTVLLMHWEWKHRTKSYAKGADDEPSQAERKILIAKNRGGMTGSVVVHFDGATQRYRDPLDESASRAVLDADRSAISDAIEPDNRYDTGDGYAVDF